jgi:anti-sigma factor RsiW
VNCTRLHQVLDAHIDGELDAETSREITAHLAECTVCTTLHDHRMALQQALRAHAPYYNAPASLAPTLRRAILQSAASAKPHAVGLPWFHAAAFATLAALAGMLGGYWLAQPQPDHPLREPAVASHVAALTPNRQLIEIASSDRHSVKPWFQGRIDFTPPVKDLAGEGYTLVGARIDQVADKSAAAVVYRIRKHVINLFVWRASDLAPDAIATSSVRGFSVATWAAGGLRFAAVSDVDGRDLTRFAQLVSAP